MAQASSDSSPVADDNSNTIGNSKHKKKSKGYTTKKWSFNEIGFELGKYYIQLRYHGVKKEIYFLSNITNEPTNDLDTILQRLTNNKDESDTTIYLEWCHLSTGKYYYFNLHKLFNHFKQPTIDTTKLFKNNEKAKEKQNINDEKSNETSNDKEDELILYEFDENESLKNRLKSNDILLLSPYRSLLDKFTLIGSFNVNNKSLYLGPYPTKEFVTDCKCGVLFNCTAKANKQGITNLDNMKKEIIFDVSGWRWGNRNKNKNKKSQMTILDENIDTIWNELKENNVLVHCLAGAHRSPFIVACFLVKYGIFKQELILKRTMLSTTDIYKYLKDRRKIVQPLSYGQTLDQYIAYLVGKMK